MRTIATFVAALSIVAAGSTGYAQTNCAAQLTSSSLLPAFLDCLVQQQTELTSLREQVEALSSAPTPRVPTPTVEWPGALVAAFSGAGCPEGWSPFQAAAGRMIVGAGVNNHSDERGVALTDYSVLAVGGEEQVILTWQQMPAHTHQYRGALEVGRPFPGGAESDTFGDPDLRNTEPAGGNDPHNNMPPYVALTWCSPDG